jgi:hypothetical protein
LDLKAKPEKTNVSFSFAKILKNPFWFITVPVLEFTLKTIPFSNLIESFIT